MSETPKRIRPNGSTHGPWSTHPQHFVYVSVQRGRVVNSTSSNSPSLKGHGNGCFIAGRVRNLLLVDTNADPGGWGRGQGPINRRHIKYFRWFHGVCVKHHYLFESLLETDGRVEEGRSCLCPSCWGRQTGVNFTGRRGGQRDRGKEERRQDWFSGQWKCLVWITE